MAFNSESNEASRKTLDDIRREIDAEYGYVAPAESALDDATHDRARGVARTDPRMVQRLERLSEHEEREGSVAPLADFRQIADRHQLGMRRRSPVSGGAARRSGYLLAGLVGCVAGQILLLAVLTVMRYGGGPEVSHTSAQVSPSSDVTSAAPSEAVASSPSSAPVVVPVESQESTAESSGELPPRTVREPPASSSPPRAIVSAATVPEHRLPHVVRERRPASPGSDVAASSNRADAQARLRSALDRWRRISAVGVGSVEMPEPVIVLSPDGRTAKIYVSVASQIGFIPREQRWTLGPRGWALVEDRQAGLPIAGPPPTSRDR